MRQLLLLAVGLFPPALAVATEPYCLVLQQGGSADVTFRPIVIVSAAPGEATSIVRERFCVSPADFNRLRRFLETHSSRRVRGTLNEYGKLWLSDRTRDGRVNSFNYELSQAEAQEFLTSLMIYVSEMLMGDDLAQQLYYLRRHLAAPR